MILVDTNVLSEITKPRPTPAEAYGDILAEAERRGQRLNIADGQIAAIARVHGMDFATRNAKDFAASGGPLVSPWD